MKKRSIAFLCGAALVGLALPALSSAQWTGTSWKTHSVWEFAVDNRPIGGILRETTIWTKWTNNSNRSRGDTANTFHAVSNWCVDPVSGAAGDTTSPFAGPNVNSAIVHTCPDSRVSTHSAGWIWAPAP